MVMILEGAYQEHLRSNRKYDALAAESDDIAQAVQFLASKQFCNKDRVKVSLTEIFKRIPAYINSEAVYLCRNLGDEFKIDFEMSGIPQSGDSPNLIQLLFLADLIFLEGNASLTPAFQRVLPTNLGRKVLRQLANQDSRTS